MDHAIAGVCVEPIQTRVIGRNTDLRGNGGWFPIDVDGHMGVNVKVAMFAAITRYAVYSRVGSVGRRLRLYNCEIDEGSNNQHRCRDDASSRDAFPAGGTPPLFLTPLLFLAASLLPRTLMSRLLTHKGSRFLRCLYHWR